MRYLQTLRRFTDDGKLAGAYEKSGGLCAPHLVRVIECGAGHAGLGRLLDRTLALWETTREALQRFVEKHDYRNTRPFTEAEAESCLRAFEVLAGRRGVHGNDLHAAVAVRPRATTLERT